MMIARIFSMAVRNFRNGFEIEDVFKDFDCFIANPVTVDHDIEALQLLQSFWSKISLSSNIVTLSNFRLFNGLIMRNTQKISPISIIERKILDLIESGLHTGTDHHQKLTQQFQLIIEKDMKLFEMLRVEGSGLFILENSMNHSCDPNLTVVSCFDNYQIQLVANREISSDEELTFSYIDESLNVDQRQKVIFRPKYLTLFACSN
jgi:hypothetical protein